MSNVTHVFDCFGISDIGLIREINEDVWAIYPEINLFLLADGMGGHLAGEVAAKEAVSYLAQLVKKWKPREDLSPKDAEFFFSSALKETNQWIHKKASSDISLNGMGTTLSLLYFYKKTAIFGHVGDSRIYRLRNARLTQMTEDHSLVSEMLALGIMDSEEAKAFPYKHILTRAIGSHPTVEPTVSSAPMQSRDLYLLCSDGLTNFVKDDEIKDILLKESSLEEKGQELVTLSNQHGGGDNVTCIIVDVQA